MQWSEAVTLVPPTEMLGGPAEHPPEAVLAKERYWQRGYAAFNQRVRAEALAALDQLLRVQGSAPQAQISAWPLVQARNVPWRVSVREVQQVRLQTYHVQAVPQSRRPRLA